MHDAIDRYGYQVVLVDYGTCSCPGCDGSGGDDDSPPFAYTVGLHRIGRPELLVFGLPRPVASRLLRELATAVVAGGDPPPVGEVFSASWWWPRFVPEEVPNPREVLLFAAGDCPPGRQQDLRALQLTHEDPLGRFPWEPGYALPWLQPRPGTFRA